MDIYIYVSNILLSPKTNLLQVTFARFHLQPIGDQRTRSAIAKLEKQVTDLFLIQNEDR